jgi:proteic killer suppression protein
MLDMMYKERYREDQKVIKSFADEGTRKFWETGTSASVPAKVHKVAARKLDMIDAAKELHDLKVPPGNKLHPLKGDRLGLYAIWINAKYRVCFRWKDGNAYEIEITDYH